jgi:hypothetical protein
MLMISKVGPLRKGVAEGDIPRSVEVAVELGINSPGRYAGGNQTMTIRRTLGVAAAGMSLATTAVAHHGFGNFDLKREVMWDGVITRVDFVNPHAYVYFDVPAADGTRVPHRCEMRAAGVLRRSGWSPAMFKAGDPIRITGAPDRYDANSCYVNTVVFADGTTADRYAQLSKPAAPAPTVARAARLPSGEPNLNGDWAPEQLVMTDPQGRQGALVPVSQASQFKPGERAAGGGPPPSRPRVTYTEAGKQAADAFRNFSPDNPRMRCETTSILFDWTFDGPVNRITQTPDTITLQYGQLGFTRTIHMDMQEHPANVEPTRAGHSIGHWENDELVVDTVGFAPGVLSPPIMNSSQLHVVERFALDPEKMTITRSYTAEDPVNFTDQFTGRDTIGVADLPYSPDPCKELTFDDYSRDGVAPNQGSPGNTVSAGSAGAPAPQKSWWKFWEWFN